MTYSASSYPYDTVVSITDVIGNTYYQGSGVLISPDEVLTASHVVYMQGVGTASDIVVTPGYSDGSSPYGSAYGTYIQYNSVNDSNDNITNQQSQYDYAIIQLSTPFTSAGYMGIEANFAGGPVDITGYPASAAGSQVTSSQSVAQDPNYTLLDGTALGKGSSGGPVWIETAEGPEVVGIVSSESGTSSTGYNTLITASVYNQIEAWLQQDNTRIAGAPSLGVVDTTTGQTIAAAAQAYTGSVNSLQNQYINITSDSLNIAVSTPNWFLHSGTGNDAIVANSGTNVLDGGTGSNFLTGGSGSDTFFVDDLGPTASIWSTINNMHTGDSATIWGVTPSDFTLSWVGGQGASGYTGLTLHVAAAGMPTASLTLVGFSSADLINGRLTASYGTTAAAAGVPGSAYMNIHAN